MFARAAWPGMTPVEVTKEHTMLRTIGRYLVGAAARRFLLRRVPLLFLGYEAYKAYQWYQRRNGGRTA